MIGAAGRADAGAFLVRLLRLDPAAVVRLRPTPRAPRGGGGFAEMWAMLPFRVLVVRLIADVTLAGDLTVDAAPLLRTLADEAVGPGGRGAVVAAQEGRRGRVVEPLRRRDEAWRWALPTLPGRVVETVPDAEVARVAAAASRTLRQVSSGGIGGRRVGERVLRDALLDHVSIVATSPDGERIDVPQRLVQAVVRMGFLGATTRGRGEDLTFGDTSITVRRSGTWIGLDGSYGSAWYKPISSQRLS